MDPKQVREVELLGGSFERGVHVATGRVKLSPRGSKVALQIIPFKLEFDPSKGRFSIFDLTRTKRFKDMLMKNPWDDPEAWGLLKSAMVAYTAEAE